MFLLLSFKVYFFLTANVTSGGIEDDDDDVPELVEDFEAASKSDASMYVFLFLLLQHYI